MLKIIKLPEVKNLTALSRSQIYRLISQKKFPAKILLGGTRGTGWVQTEILSWIKDRIEESRNGGNS
jgi:prophage regulatory protein